MLQERKKFTQTLCSVACVIIIIIITVIITTIKTFSTITQYVQFNFRLTDKIRITNILLLFTLQRIEVLI